MWAEQKAIEKVMVFVQGVGVSASLAARRSWWCGLSRRGIVAAVRPAAAGANPGPGGQEPGSFGISGIPVIRSGHRRAGP